MVPPAYKYLALDMPVEETRQTSSDATAMETEHKESVVAAAIVKPLQGFEGLQHQRSKKWERSPDNNVLDIEAKLAALPNFSTDEEVTGLITMEDVIEELLQV